MNLQVLIQITPLVYETPLVFVVLHNCQFLLEELVSDLDILGRAFATAWDTQAKCI